MEGATKAREAELPRAHAADSTCDTLKEVGVAGTESETSPFSVKSALSQDETPLLQLAASRQDLPAECSRFEFARERVAVDDDVAVDVADGTPAAAVETIADHAPSAAAPVEPSACFVPVPPGLTACADSDAAALALAVAARGLDDDDADDSPPFPATKAVGAVKASPWLFEPSFLMAQNDPDCAAALRAPAAVPPTKGRLRPPWCVVWCHERCHKMEEAPLRIQIAEWVAARGGALRCYKKAKTFEAWVSRTSVGPYILFTDGREVKPCVDALLSRLNNQPLAIIISCPRKVPAERVSRWCTDMFLRGFTVPLHIIYESVELEPLLDMVPLSILRGFSEGVHMYVDGMDMYGMPYPAPCAAESSTAKTAPGAGETPNNDDIFVVPPGTVESSASARPPR